MDTCERKGKGTHLKPAPPAKTAPAVREEEAVENVLSISSWTAVDTCFGEILRGPCGRTLFPPGLFEEIEEEMKLLSRRCDLSKELKSLKDAMYQEFTISAKPPIYDAVEFEKFCDRVGAHKIFNSILSAMTDERHSSERIAFNKKRTVVILYKLCYGLSQLCNWLQTDHAVFLKNSNVNKEALITQRVMGNSCSKTKTNDMILAMYQSAAKEINNIVEQAISNKWQVVLVIDDYTSIHSIRRPKTETLSNPKYMCTIIMKVFKNVQAVPACPATAYHNPCAIDIASCIKTVSGLPTMIKLAQTYSSVMPTWIKDSFFTPDFERYRVTTHQYCDHESVKNMRQMDDVHLVNFFELTLKSKGDFEAAFDAILNTKLSDYMKLYLTPQPGDWPAQFYSRQIVYDSLLKFHACATSDVPTNTVPPSPSDHSYSTVNFDCESTRKKQHLSTSNQPKILSVIPCIGPLHISLNARETVFNNFRPFFETVYTQIFPRSKLAKKPKPWRISLILEVTYGGWLFIRDTIKDKFSICKDLEYRTLLNLLDNYLPLILTIYSVTFKLNNFNEYFNGIIRIWTMFVCLERHHYNKAPLVWLAMCTYWGIYHPGMYNLLRQSLAIFDEYPVENAHSIIRSKTNTNDTAEKLEKKAKAIFQSKRTQKNFKDNFTPSKKQNHALNNLRTIKAKCAVILTSMFSQIAKHPGKASFIEEGKKKKVLLPRVFGNEKMKIKVLPLGYCCSTMANQEKRCDLQVCKVTRNEPWTLFEGCSHSFHNTCLLDASFCPLCQQFLADKAQSLAKIAQNAILHPKENNEPLYSQSSDTDGAEEDEDTASDIPVTQSSDNEDVDKQIKSVNDVICALPSPQAPPVMLTSSSSQRTSESPSQEHHQQTVPLQSSKRVPKCKNCHHPRKGHTNAKNGPVACPACQGGLCTGSVNSPQPTAVQGHQSQQHVSLTSSIQCNVILESIQEWILPYYLSQTTVFGLPLGSNACTVIAAIGAMKFLNTGDLLIPSPSRILRCVATFANSMREGIALYNTLNLPPTQPNLTASEALETRSDQFGLQIIEDTGIFSQECLTNKLNGLCSHPQDQCIIMITPPDKSMLLCFSRDEQKIALFESHPRGNNGGLIAVASYQNVDKLVLFLSYMCNRDWGTGIAGSNLAVIRSKYTQ
ncbi:uncharacterized protein LOC114575348 [Exaiptasia diaphana]|uniref:RING-type domain-containing protein n=1 Tax=Exaiptasia diaphana TaxID=2652724 RepID=A0A913YL49_EXADI|nr:uncharacterized protein LOC114575348 [Exaiptasia diaphana]